MAHEFVIIRQGVTETYTNFEDIPLDLEHVIKFLPDIADGPHTPEQHDEIDSWNEKLQMLLEIERQNAKHL